MDRRKFIRKISGLTVLSLLSDSVFNKVLADKRITPKKIVIRAGWATDTLQDRLYLPSVFKLVQRNIPGAEIYFWPDVADEPVLERIKSNTLKLRLMTGKISLAGNPDTADFFSTLDSSDMLIHAGGFVGPGMENNPAHLHNSLDTFNYCVNKGILFGIHSLRQPFNFTPDERIIKTFNDASFVYTSSPFDRKAFENAGVKNKNAEYSPDACFHYDMGDESLMMKYIYSIDFAGKDYMLLHLRRSDQLMGNLDLEKNIILYKDIIDSWISETGNPVLLIPGDNRDVQYIRDTFLSELNEDYKKKVILKEDLSDPGELLSLIDKSRICIGNDPGITMLAINSRVPVIYTPTKPEDQFSTVLKTLSLGHRIFDVNTLSQDDMIKVMFDIQKKYVNAMLEVDHAMKLVVQEELNSLKTINGMLKDKTKKNKKEEKTK